MRTYYQWTKNPSRPNVFIFHIFALSSSFRLKSSSNKSAVSQQADSSQSAVSQQSERIQRVLRDHSVIPSEPKILRLVLLQIK